MEAQGEKRTLSYGLLSYQFTELPTLELAYALESQEKIVQGQNEP